MPLVADLQNRKRNLIHIVSGLLQRITFKKRNREWEYILYKPKAGGREKWGVMVSWAWNFSLR